MREAYNEDRNVFNTMTDMMDAKGWRYKKYEDDLSIMTQFSGDDFSMDLMVIVKPKQKVVAVYSILPFEMPEDKRIDGALAVCAANYWMVDGGFDYDVRNGKIMFRLTSSYRNSILSEELFEYMIGVSCSTIDQYNDKFFMIAKGMMSVQDFIKQEEK